MFICWLLGHMVHQQQSPGWMSLVCFTHQSTSTSSLYELGSFIYSHLTSSFVAITITTATGGRHLTLNVNMGCNNLLPQSTYVVVSLMNKGFHYYMLVQLHLLYYITSPPWAANIFQFVPETWIASWGHRGKSCAISKTGPIFRILDRF